MIGTSAVGKTSLVKQFVQGIFSEQYLTTIGVKIDKKAINIGDSGLELLIWDLNGEDRFQKLSMNYLRGMAGYLLVVDGTRKATMNHVLDLQQRIVEKYGSLPFILLLNKADLVDQWDFSAEDLARLDQAGWSVIKTSAKSGTGVEEAFTSLGKQLIGLPV